MNVGPYDSQLMEMQHGQRLADMLRMNAMQPIQSVSSSPLASISPLQVMAQALMGYSANRAGNKHMEDMRNLSQMMQGDTNAGLAQFQKEYAVDPMQAVTNAMAARSPVIQALGKAALKGVAQPKDLMKAATNESILASGGNPIGYKPKLELKTVEPGKPLMDQGGNIVNPTSVQPGAAPNYQKIDGDLYGITPTGMDQINKAPRVNVRANLNMPVGETEFEKGFAQKEAARLSDELAQRPGKLEGLQAAQDSLKLLDQGIHTGILADIQKNLEKGYGAIASKEPEKAARTEQFIANVGNLVIPRLKDFGGSDTVEEMKYLQQVMGGNVKLEASTLRNILNSVSKKLQHRVQETDKAVEMHRRRGKSLPTIDTGVQQELPQNNVPTLDEFFKSKGL